MRNLLEISRAAGSSERWGSSPSEWLNSIFLAFITLRHCMSVIAQSVCMEGAEAGRLEVRG